MGQRKYYKRQLKQSPATCAIAGMRVGSDEKNENFCDAKKTELNLYYIGN